MRVGRVRRRKTCVTTIAKPPSWEPFGNSLERKHQILEVLPFARKVPASETVPVAFVFTVGRQWAAYLGRRTAPN